MSDYTSCIIEFKRENGRALADLIADKDDCFCEGYITPKTIIVHYNGNRYDSCSDWREIVDKAYEIEEEHGDFFHTYSYSTEYAIEENGGFYEGYAYVGLGVNGNYEPYFAECFEKFAEDMGKAVSE